MQPADAPIVNLAIAFGIGLLIGAERERRKGEGPSRSPAGVRTFAIGSMLGAVSMLLGGVVLLAVSLIGSAALLAIAYQRTRQRDPGLTTEVALLLTVLLGGLALRQPAIAAGLGAAVTGLLAARVRLHYFVRDALSEEEMNDAVIFAAAILVVLPLVPDQYMGPFHAINPRTIWKIVIVMMSISAAGYVAVRMFGVRLGLPIAGLASGFVSSAATIGSMGARAAQEPSILRPAVAGAVLSTVATVCEMAIVLAATSLATLRSLAIPLLCSGIVACVYGTLFTIHTIRGKNPRSPEKGHAFRLQTALLFTATIATVLVASAALHTWFGQNGVLAAAAIAGFADTHSAAVSVAALVGAGRLTATQSTIPILAALSTNTITKMVLACTSGGTRFALQIIPGLLLVVLAAWLGLFLTPA